MGYSDDKDVFLAALEGGLGAYSTQVKKSVLDEANVEREANLQAIKDSSARERGSSGMVDENGKELSNLEAREYKGKTQSLHKYKSDLLATERQRKRTEEDEYEASESYKAKIANQTQMKIDQQTALQDSLFSQKIKQGGSEEALTLADLKIARESKARQLAFLDEMKMKGSPEATAHLDKMADNEAKRQVRINSRIASGKIIDDLRANKPTKTEKQILANMKTTSEITGELIPAGEVKASVKEELELSRPSNNVRVWNEAAVNKEVYNAMPKEARDGIDKKKSKAITAQMTSGHKAVPEIAPAPAVAPTALRQTNEPSYAKVVDGKVRYFSKISGEEVAPPTPSQAPKTGLSGARSAHKAAVAKMAAQREGK